MPATPAQPREFLSAREAAELLGVRPQTLYAYVSRGLIRSVPDGNSRQRRYHRQDVERARQRATARSPDAMAASVLDLGHPIVATGITEITAAGPSYRGRPALVLARQGASFEQVAELLWTGLWHEEEVRWGGLRRASPIPALIADVGAGAARHQLLELFATVVMRMAMGRGPVHERLIAGHPLDAARELIQVLAGCFGVLGAQGGYVAVRGGLSVAESLLLALGRAPDEADRRLLDATLVLLADHELSPATFAARIAASAGCSVQSCIGAAIAASSGTQVGRRYGRIEDLLDASPGAAMLARAAALAESGQAVPGFEHPVYPQGDPRAAHLLALLRARARPPRELARALELVDEVERRFGFKPRHELAVVAVCRALRLPRNTAAALFVLARVAGWVAHVLEQRVSSTLIRPRARFIAPDAQQGGA